MNQAFRNTKTSRGTRHVESEEPVSGSVFAFVPAHGGSRVSLVSQQLSRALAEDFGLAVLRVDFDAPCTSPWTAMESPRRLDGRTWGAFVSQVGGIDVLDPCEVHPGELRPLLETAREKYAAVCVDLTHAKESHALEILRASDGIFLVGGSDPASLHGVREKVEWLRSVDLADQCGLLLARASDGAEPAEAEELAGVPLCSLIDGEENLARLAGWLAAERGRRQPAYALAV